MARVPIFGEAGIKEVINGPIAYTPDGSPLVGPAWDLRNFWLNEGHSFGVTAAGGTGWQLAEWIVEGDPGIDLMDVDPRRFGAYAGKNYTRLKNEEAYEHVFVIHYPDEERPGRPAAEDQPDSRPLRFHGRGVGPALRLGAAQLVRARGRGTPGTYGASGVPTTSSMWATSAATSATTWASSTSPASRSSRSPGRAPRLIWIGWCAGCCAAAVGRINLSHALTRRGGRALRVHHHARRSAGILSGELRRRRAIRPRLPVQEPCPRTEACAWKT